jgi:glycerol-3-phosphate dehydrogenase (NAD(P)+)
LIEMRIAVIGDGGWGTAIALVLAANGHDVRLWGAFPEYAAEVQRTRANRKFLPGFDLPSAIRVTGDDAEAFDGAELAFSVVPTQHLRTTWERLKPRWRGIPVVTATKGLEVRSVKRPSEILREVLGEAFSLCVFSGPSHAEEVARGKATVVVAGSADRALAERVQQVCFRESFRVYRSDDPIGVELGGALKNIIAIAAGICDGLDLGDNAKAALLTRGLVEMARFGEAHGAKRETFAGLAGMGDLITTCYSGFGRNRGVGERLGRGETLAQILSGMEMVAEGVWTAQAIHGAAEDARIRMPITTEVYRVLFEAKSARRAVLDLMSQTFPGEE